MLAFIVLFFSFVITESSSSPFSGHLLATAIQQHSPLSFTGESSGGYGGSGGAVGGNVTNNINCFYAATAPLIPTANLPPGTSTTATALSSLSSSLPPAAISPTFIEHKYSANSFKEKFFANLRQQNLNKIKSLRTSSSIKQLECDGGNHEINSLRNLDIAAGEILMGCGDDVQKYEVDNGGGGSNGCDGVSIENDVNVGAGSETLSQNNNTSSQQTEMCSSIQQFSENVKNNLYKKTIN